MNDDWLAKHKRIWDEARSIVDTIAERYMQHRGLPFVGHEHALRFHHACPVKIGDKLERRPALVGKLVDIRTNAFCAIQRAFLKRDGSGKADDIPGGARRMLGRAEGAVCKLSADEEVTTVFGIGEGIETTLSLPLLPECHGVPVWACMSASNIENLPPLPGIEVLWIAVDKEESGVGERAAYQCAERWDAADKEVHFIFVKDRTQKKCDLNDLVRKRGDHHEAS
jgi:hypothetical protein